MYEENSVIKKIDIRHSYHQFSAQKLVHWSAPRRNANGASRHTLQFYNHKCYFNHVGMQEPVQLWLREKGFELPQLDTGGSNQPGDPAPDMQLQWYKNEAFKALRNHQQDAVIEIDMAVCDEGHSTVLVEMWCGTGKSLVEAYRLSECANARSDLRGLQVFVAPFVDLVLQFLDSYVLNLQNKPFIQPVAKMFEKFDKIIIFCSAGPSPDRKRENLLFLQKCQQKELEDFFLEAGTEQNILLITTYRSFFQFASTLIKTNNTVHRHIQRLVVDEAHHVLEERACEEFLRHASTKELVKYAEFYTATPTKHIYLVGGKPEIFDMKPLPKEDGGEIVGCCGKLAHSLTYKSAVEKSIARPFKSVVLSFYQGTEGSDKTSDDNIDDAAQEKEMSKMPEDERDRGIKSRKLCIYLVMICTSLTHNVYLGSAVGQFSWQDIFSVALHEVKIQNVSLRISKTK